ncbi:MAG: hypothetical protein MUF38_20330 [Anaerolineae bacterium]|jgi:hypothetical protein|nr:hypothetical protein [Anaerolineae bacterium]
MRHTNPVRLSFVLVAMFAALLMVPLVGAAMSAPAAQDGAVPDSAPALAPVMALTQPPYTILLSNPGFEFVGGSTTQASSWDTARLNPKDGRYCMGINPGDCTFRFRGANATSAPRTLSQTIAANANWGSEGETLLLWARVKTQQLSGPSRVLLTVTYTDDTTERVNVRIPAGDNPYQTLVTELTLTKPAASATVTVRVKTGGTAQTRLWVDEIILRVE